MSHPLPGAGAAASPLRRILVLAIPAVVSELAAMGMGLVDTLMVGRLGPRELAAVGLGNSVFFPLFLLAMGVILALDTLIAQAAGQGDDEAAGGLLGQGLWVALALGIPLSLALRHMEPVLLRLGQPPEVAHLCALYLDSLSWCAVPFLAFTATRSFFYGLGDTRSVMVVTLLANAVNAAADYAVLQGSFGFPKLGVAGLGYATTCSRTFMFLALVALARRRRFAAHRPRLGTPDPALIRRILVLGLPIGALILFEAGGFSGAAMLIGNLGELPLAGHQIVITMASTTFMVPLGISSAAAVAVGQEMGRGDLARAALMGRLALGLATAAMALSGLCFWLLPGLLARLFTPDPTVIAVAASLFPIAACFQIFDGLQCVAAGALRGAGDTQAPMLANLAGYWGLGLPLGWALGFPGGLGARGVWWGLALALVFTAAVLTLRFLRGTWSRGLATQR